jgi:hypothetical protein
MAGPIMQRCADNPEALQQLAQMSPAERSRWLSKLEGHLEAELKFGQQLAGQQQQWQQERRVTHAPPIIHPPRGAANPPSDLHRWRTATMFRITSGSVSVSSTRNGRTNNSDGENDLA